MTDKYQTWTCDCGCPTYHVEFEFGRTTRPTGIRLECTACSKIDVIE